MKRRITGIVALQGKLYREGDEQKLAAVAERYRTDLTDPVFASGLAGDWSDVSDVIDDALPEGFPGLAQLVAAEKLTYTDLQGETIDTLTEVPGIGRATARKIVQAVRAR